MCSHRFQMQSSGNRSSSHCNIPGLHPVVPPKHFNTPMSAIQKPGVTFSSVVAKADSGASCHYFRPQDAPILRQVQHIQTSPTVQLPDDTTITGNKKGLLPLSSSLSNCAKTAHIFPHLKSASLVSLGQLCDNDCVVILNKNEIIVKKKNKTVLKGHHNFTDGLWDISLSTFQPNKSPRSSSIKAPSTFQQSANIIIRKKSNY